MSRLGKIIADVHYEVGETVNRLGLVRWLFTCLVCNGEYQAEEIAAVAAFAGLQDHILDKHAEVVA